MKNIFYRTVSIFMCLMLLFTQIPIFAHKKISCVSYEHYDTGNVSVIKEDNVPKIWYFYDEKGQLIRENNKVLNKTITYFYDSRGNIQNKKVYAFRQDSPENQTPENTVIYEYADSDKMISYNGQKITYDKFGNSINYRGGLHFKWNKNRQLIKSINLCNDVEYVYNDSGIRTQKKVNNITTDFLVDGTQILSQKSGENVINWRTDESDKFDYNGTKYTYIRNLQGDVTEIVDVYGNVVVNYIYDTWGKLISIKDGNGKDVTNDKTHIGYINPIRYRGYYYDSETKLYYLNSRYYDPEVGRFINEDDKEFLKNLYVDMIDISEYNLYAYCNNNPVNMADFDGHEGVLISGTAIFLVGAAAILIYTAIINSPMYTGNLQFKTATDQTIGWAIQQGIESISAILDKFLSIAGQVVRQFAEWASNKISELVKAYKVEQIQFAIPSKLKTPDGRVDLSKFTNRDGPLGPCGSGRGILSAIGWYISKDMAQHGDVAWKLFDKFGNKIATLDAVGKIIRWAK